MGNKQNSFLCADCTTIQIEDYQFESKRNNFQMTKLRNFSHYSRDFQVEQKFNWIKQNKPNYQLKLEIIFPDSLIDQKDELILKCGKTKKQKRMDKNTQSINRLFQVCDLDLYVQIKSQSFEDKNELYKKLVTKKQEEVDLTNAFLILIDNDISFEILQKIIDIIHLQYNYDSLIYLIGSNQSSKSTFVEDKEQLKVDTQNSFHINTCQNYKQISYQDIEMTQHDQRQMNENVKKSIAFNSFKQDTCEQKSYLLQNNFKNLIESNYNLDFICINYDSAHNINQKLEYILSQCIYSEDSRLRSTQL